MPSVGCVDSTSAVPSVGCVNSTSSVPSVGCVNSTSVVPSVGLVCVPLWYEGFFVYQSTDYILYDKLEQTATH